MTTHIRSGDHYAVLGVAPTATTAEVRAAYKRKALALHPDRNAEADPTAFQAVANAYEVLGDTARRREYDHQLAAAAAVAAPGARWAPHQKQEVSVPQHRHWVDPRTNGHCEYYNDGKGFQAFSYHYSSGGGGSFDQQRRSRTSFAPSPFPSYFAQPENDIFSVFDRDPCGAMFWDRPAFSVAREEQRQRRLSQDPVFAAMHEHARMMNAMMEQQHRMMASMFNMSMGVGRGW